MKAKFTQPAIERPFTPHRLWLLIKGVIARKVFFKEIMCLFFITMIHDRTPAQRAVIDPTGEGYFFHTNDYPNNQSPYWGDDDALTNGITHDDDSWIITALGTNRIGQSNDDWIIRKIPVNKDLMTSTVFKSVRRSQVPVLDALGYNHPGDLDHYKYHGKTYLIVPFEKVKNLHPAIAIFLSSNLSFVDYSFVPKIADGIGWCAVSPVDGCLYTTNDAADAIFIYTIDWSALEKNHKLIITFKKELPLKNMNGDRQTYHDMQGGEFSTSGRFLYVNSGIISCACKHRIYDNDGLHVFDTNSWEEIQHSVSGVTVTDNCPFYAAFPGTQTIRKAQTGCFDYTFDNSGCSGEEPEGLTIWDMDKVPGHDRHVSGQLHVISYNHNNSVFNENAVKLKHYKGFKFPKDITVYGTTPANGEPATNPAIKKFLNQGTTFGGCAEVLYNHPPPVFPPGKTPVVFTVTDHKTVKVQNTAYVTVINRRDECSTALTLNESDSVITDNFCATTSDGIPDMQGYNGVIKDVWFKIYPSSAFLSVETFQIPGGLTNTVMQAFSGSCDNLNEIASNNTNGSGGQSKIILANLPDLNPIYIRITDFGGDEYGKFGICYKKLDPCVAVPQRHDECSTALLLNESDSVVTDNFCATTSSKLPAIPGYIGAIKDVWFKIYPTSAFLSVETFQIPGGLTNTVMQAFSGTCDSLYEIVYNYNSGHRDQAKITLTNLPNLNPIYIRVTDFGGDNYGKFGIIYKKISPCATVNSHDECSTALPLNESDSVITDNFCATTSSGIPPMPGYAGVIKDVWFKIYPSSASLSVETFQIPGGLTNTIMQAFSGSCDNLHEIANDDNSGEGDHAKITLTNLPDLNPIYVRVAGYGGNDYGKFGIHCKQLAPEGNVTTQQGTYRVWIYPNPASETIRIITEAPGEYEAQILDLSGRPMLPKARFTASKQIDITPLLNGIYFVDIYDIKTGKRIVKRIMKMK